MRKKLARTLSGNIGTMMLGKRFVPHNSVYIWPVKSRAGPSNINFVNDQCGSEN